MDKWLDFLRGFVRPYVAYILISVFAGLVAYAFVKFGDAEMAKTLIVAFVGIVGTIVGVYFGMRSATKPPGGQ